MARHPFVTVDTEFLRETTYYPLLCVAQMASPEEAVVVEVKMETGTMEQEITLELHGKSNTGHVAVVI